MHYVHPVSLVFLHETGITPKKVRVGAQGRVKFGQARVEERLPKGDLIPK
jgi:hypothetical protein